jgi:NAD binding domain of 6-phosphogluconate dehydrogenase.
MFNFKEIFMEIGFIGLGAMGSRIAKNILIKRKN